MKKTEIRRGQSGPRLQGPGGPQPGSGMDEAVEDILFSIADRPRAEEHAPQDHESERRRKPEHNEH